VEEPPLLGKASTGDFSFLGGGAGVGEAKVRGASKRMDVKRLRGSGLTRLLWTNAHFRKSYLLLLAASVHSAIRPRRRYDITINI
jgi:hypothetical protein